ncbi:MULTISPECIES: antitermination protein [Pantoea]|uniref:antitermination protein Q n=1 Tax=Pantoea TaxID=53335 RepID=UPI00057E669B|nr:MULTISPECIES: antitermination protein [Pantoea]
MKLENVVKYHSPRSVSPFIRQTSRSPNAMTGSDVMAALGMMQKRAALGYSAFFGKMQLSHHDKGRAVRLLAKTGLRVSSRYPALTKLPEEERMAVITVIAGYAFLDYARSPDTEAPCHACNGTGLRNGKCCSKCGGKGVVRAACKDCKGRGESINRVMTQFQGVPVYQPCKRCSGRGFERIPSSVVFRAMCQVTDAITLDTWNKSVKQLLEFLVAELHREEAWAEKQLLRITK